MFVLAFPLEVNALDVSPDPYLKAYFSNDLSLSVVKLNGGLSGAMNYKVTADGRDYVLRVLDAGSSLKDRQREIKAAVYAGKLGIAPSVHYVSPEYTAFIMDFVSGPTLSADMLQNQETLALLVKTIHKLHDSRGDFPQGYTAFEVIRLKFKRVSPNTSPISWQWIEKALNKLDSLEEKFKSQTLVPCHNDLNSLNIILSKKGFSLIDWTEASINYAYIDLGYFNLTNRIPEKQYSEFLSLYLGYCPSNQELNLLKWGREVAILRLFSTIFFDLEKPITDEGQRVKRQTELEQMLEDPSLPALDYFIDLHRKGLLNTSDLALKLSLSALRSFLN